MAEHRYYLSVSTSECLAHKGKRMWRVICNGQPLCADTDELTARKVAEMNKPQFKGMIPIWDGDKGEFI